jgi:hypothetical protein
MPDSLARLSGKPGQLFGSFLSDLQEKFSYFGEFS